MAYNKVAQQFSFQHPNHHQQQQPHHRHNPQFDHLQHQQHQQQLHSTSVVGTENAKRFTVNNLLNLVGLADYQRTGAAVHPQGKWCLL